MPAIDYAILATREPEMMETSAGEAFYRIPILDRPRPDEDREVRGEWPPPGMSTIAQLSPAPPVTEVSTPNMQAGGVVPKRRMPRRIVRITLPEPYDDFHFDAWANIDVQKFVNDAQSLTEGVLLADDPAIADDATLDEGERATRTAERERRQTAYAEVEKQVALRLSQLLPWHDWVDFEGEPLPQPTEPAFWNFLLSHELRDIVFTAIMSERGRLDPTKPRP